MEKRTSYEFKKEVDSQKIDESAFSSLFGGDLFGVLNANVAAENPP